METDKYLPFNNWIYLKIYTGYRTADKLLTEVLYPSWRKAKRDEIADKWFFVRYSDTDFHLRFRIKFSDPFFGYDYLQQMLSELQPYSDSSLIWKLDVGTYVPETVRYGEDTMSAAEEIFCADSDTVMTYFNSIESVQDERWLFAIASIDRFLEDFEFDLLQKKDLLLKLSRGFGNEFGKNADVAKQLSSKFRNKKQEINDNISKAYPMLFERTERIHRPVKEILSLSVLGELDVYLHDLVTSIIHMSMNRVFQSHNRVYEMVLYDLLFRYYKSLSFQKNLK